MLAHSILKLWVEPSTCFPLLPVFMLRNVYMLAVQLASDSNHICLSLSWLTTGTNPSMPGWSSLKSSMLNKTCEPHAAALHYLQIPATLPPSRLSHPSLPSFSSHSSPSSQQMHFSPFPLSAFSSCSSSLSVFPPPFFLFFPTSPSLFHLIAFVLPGDRHWTERFPLSYNSHEWLTALSALPKLSRQHPPLPPVCTVEAEEEEVCKTTLLSLLLSVTLAHRDREDGFSWREKSRREETLYNKGRIERGENR